MKTKATKGISRRILTLALALIMALGSLGGAVSVTAMADEEENLAVIEPETEEKAGEEETEPVPEPEPVPEAEPALEAPTEDEEPAEEEEPSERELDVSLIVSDEAELCLKTEDKVIGKDVYPAVRLWNSEESLRYSEFALALEGEEIVTAGAVYDAAADRLGISFTEKTKVTVTGKSISGGEYILYVEDGEELKAAELERDGEALSFDAEGLSLFVLTKKAEAQEPEESGSSEEDEIYNGSGVYDQLIEVEAADNEPLLQIDELSDETLAALGIERTAAPADRKSSEPEGRASGRISDVYSPTEGEGETGGEEPDGEEPEEEEEDRLPWVSETVSIETLTIEWKAVTYNQWVDPIHRDLVCDTDYVPDQKFQIDISLNGDEIIQPGALELIFPAYLWKNRAGEEAGKLYLSVPAEPDHDAEFAWRRAGDSIIITNTHKMTSTSRILIQAAFRNVKAHDMVDGTDSRTFNDFFNVQANLTNSEGVTLTRIGNQHFTESGEPETVTVPVLDENGEQVYDEEGEPVTREEYVYTPIYATIDTHAAAKVLTKSAINPYIVNEYYTYFNIPAELPAQYLPENPEKYAYARWTIRAIASGSQPYTMTLTDTVGSRYGDMILCADGLNTDIYGVETIGPDEGTNGKRITVTLFEGYTTNARSVVIWTAYPKSTMREGVPYYVTNSAKLTVIGQDDGWDGKMENADFEGKGEMFREGVDYTVTTDEYGDSTMKPALVKEIEVSATARIQLPITYRVTKQWDDNNDAKGHRPTSQYIIIYRDGRIWREFNLREMDNAAEEDPNNPGQYIHTWTFEWDDGGQPHTYDVEERYLSYGYEHKDFYKGDEDFDPGETDDYREYYHWYYVQAGKRYDSSTHTWTFTNKYKEESYRVYRYPYVWRRRALSVSKWQSIYNYSDKTNSYDKLLNLLRRGESVIVPYSLWTYAEIYELTYDGPDTAEEWKKAENYGKRTARAELEEGEMYLTDEVNFPEYDRALEPGEYDIESINVYGYTVYEWRQDYLRDENGNYVVDEDGNYVPDPFVEWGYHSNYELTAETELQVLGCSYENGAWGEWKVYATLLNGVLTPAVDGVTVSGSTVTFPAGVHKVKTRVDSKAGEVYMGYTANIRIYPADSLVPFIEEAFEHNYAETYAMVSVRNIDEARILNPGDAEPDMELNYEATAYLHGRNFRTAASLDKEYVFSEDEGTYFEYDETKQEFIFTNRVNLILQSTVLEGNLFREFINDGTLPNTKGGTFYDLLPEGVEPVLDSIRVGVYSDYPYTDFLNGSGEDKVVDAYTIENFRNSGKTLLVVKVSFNDHFSYANEDMTEYNRSMDPAHYPKNGWRNTHTLFYQSKCVSSEAESRAVNGMIPLFTNAVAFEADEETIASLKGWQGEPDDPKADNNLRSLSELIVGDKNFTGIMTDLDPDRDSNNFVYASASVDLTAAVIQATFYGRKEASSDGIKWATGELGDINTYEGTSYSYRLRMEIEAGGAAGDIVFYDPFDAYRYLPGSTKYDGKGYWNGSLLSVDVTQLQSLGIAPVVYYYYGDGAIPASLDDLLDAGVATLWEADGWTSDPNDFGGDFSRVRAVAVDARYDTDGNEYVAQGWEEVVDDSGETQIVNGRRELVVYLHMRAPLGEEPFANSEDRFNPDENAHAYNVNYIYAQIKKGQQAGFARWNATNATKVGIIPYKIEVEKIWDDLNDNDRFRPEEITLKLYGNGELVETITVRADEEGKWRGAFMHVRRFDDDYNPIDYTIVEEPIEGYNDSEAFPEARVDRLEFDESKQSFTVTNHHDRIQTSIPFEKRWDLTLGGDDSNDRPETITVDLYRWVETTVTDEETGEEHTEGDWQFTGARKIVRPDADGNWQGSFDNVWKYEDGREIIYTVRETPVYKYITEYDESAQNDPVIINAYYPFGDLLITKQVEYATAAALEKGSFTFDLVLKYNGEEVGELYNYVKTHADGTTETGRILGVSSFTLKAGETLLIKDIRSETDYELYEHPSSGYTLQRKSGDTGVISAGETKNALFVNRYDSSAFVALNVTKELTGRALAGYQFKFEIKDAEGNLLGIAYNAASADATAAGGSAPVTLQNLNYTSEDDGKTYYYTVNEIKPENAPDYYVYDERVFGVSVSLTDNGDGTLTADVKYLGEVAEGADLAAIAASITESVEAPVFHNEYHAYGETEIKAWKTLRGGSLADYKDKFEFEVLQSDGTPLLKNGEPVVGHTDEYGTVTFPLLPFTERDVEKTYLYVVRERNTGDARIVYDDFVFGFSITVIDQGDGTLRFYRNVVAVKQNNETGNWEIDSEAERPNPIFNNRLNPGQLTVSKQITWADGIIDEDTIAALKEQKFTFRIKFYGEDLPNVVEPEQFTPYVAVIRETGEKYLSLEDACAAAEDGQTIEIIEDITVFGKDNPELYDDFLITIENKHITIDGGEYTITFINTDRQGLILADYGAGVTIEGGKWVKTGKSGYLFGYCIVFNGGSFYSNNGNGAEMMLFCNEPGTDCINGGYFNGDLTTPHANQVITGGTFGPESTAHNWGGNFLLKGGSFAKDPINHSDYNFSMTLAEGYSIIVTENDSTTIPGYSGTVYTVVKGNVITVGNEQSGAQYHSLSAAFSAAGPDDRIYLISDIEITSRQMLRGRTATIYAGNYNIKVSTTAGWPGSGGIGVCEGGNLTVYGGNWSGSQCYITVDAYYDNSYGSSINYLTVYGGTYQKPDDGWKAIEVRNRSRGYFHDCYIDGGLSMYHGTNTEVDIYSGTYPNFSVARSGPYGDIILRISGGVFGGEYDVINYVKDGYTYVAGADSIPGYEGTVYTIVPDGASTGAGGGSAPTRALARPTNGEENVSTSQDGAVSVKFEDGTLTVYPADGSEGSVTAQELRGMIEAYASTASSVFVEATVKVTGETDGDYTNGLFAQFSAMASADFSGLDIGDMTSLCGFFYGCSGIKSFDMTGWDFSGADDMSYMFMGCSSATSILLKFTSSDYRAYPDTVAYMFNACSKLRTLDLSALSFNDESTDTDGFTDGCTKLSSLTYPNDWGVYFGRGFYLPGNEWRHVESGYIVATEDFVRNNYDGSKRYGTWVLNGNEYTIEFEAEESGAVLLLTSETCPVDEDSSPLPMAYLSNHKLTGWTDGENTYAPGAVIPAYTYEAGEAVTLTAVFEENENAGEGESDYYFTLRGGEAKIFNNLPASVHYEVYELTPAGWSLVASSGTSGTIAPLTTSKAAFANKFDPGLASAQITGRKLLDGKPSSVPFSFTIERIEAPEGAAEYETKTVQSNTSGAIDFGTVSYTVEGKYVYKITENAAENYSHDSHEELVTVNVVVSGVYLTAAVEYDEDGAVFSNYTKPAEISVTKAITDDEATQNNAEGREFTFRITLTDSFERPLTGGYAKNADGELLPYVEVNGEKTELTDGTAVITLKAGETATVGNVPEKTNYFVEETSLPTGWRTVGSGTASGKTAANGSYSVTITNTYVPGSKGQTFASFTAYKELIGDTLTKDMFSFTLRQVSGPGYESFVPETVKNSALVADEESEYYNKYGVVRFSDITYTAPGVYVYEITEDEGANANVEYDGHVLTYTVTVTDDGAGKLSSSVATEGEIVFTNRMKTGSLRVEKTLENATEEAAIREFTFKLSFFDSTGTELAEEYAVRVFDSEGGLISETTAKSGGTVSIKGGESFEVIDLPHMCSYTVEEEEAAGFIRTTVSGENVTEAERKAEGIIEAGSRDEVSYTNVYATVGTANPAVRKVLKGGTITANRFKFELRDADGAVVDTAYAAEDGSISFSTLDFTYEDDGKVLEYWVYEIDTGETDVIYDLEPIKITVEVHDNGMGEMAAEITYDGEDARQGVFTNYGAVDLTVTKRVRGSVSADEFSYTVEFKNSEGSAYDPVYVPDSWTKLEAGKYTFTLADGESESVKLPYGTTYEITEAEGEYFQTFEVVSENGTTHDFGDGGIVERTIGDHSGEDVIYYNSAFELVIEKELIGYTGGEELSFEFSAVFKIGDEVYELSALPEGWEKKESGEYSFTLKSGESTRVFLPYGVTYTVTEIDPDGQYVKTCVITNEDGEENLGGGSAEHTIGESGNEKVSFTNFRMQTLTIEKVVYGDDKDGIFTFTVSFKYKGEPYDPETPENWTKLENGKYSFKLKDGRSASVKLPYGATYEVSETADERFIAKVYLEGETDPISTSGSVAEREITDNDRITFANCEKVTVTVEKTVKGDMGNAREKFTFRLKLSLDGTAIDLEETPEGFERIEAGEYEFKLAHGESVSFTVLGGVRYEICEVTGARYETKYRVGGGDWLDGKTAVSENAGTTETVSFENTYESNIPTGLSIGMGGTALLAASLLGAAGFIFLRKRKHEE